MESLHVFCCDSLFLFKITKLRIIHVALLLVSHSGWETEQGSHLHFGLLVPRDKWAGGGITWSLEEKSCGKKGNTWNLGDSSGHLRDLSFLWDCECRVGNSELRRGENEYVHISSVSLKNQPWLIQGLPLMGLMGGLA